MKIKITGKFTVHGLEYLKSVKQPLIFMELEIPDNAPYIVNEVESDMS